MLDISPFTDEQWWLMCDCGLSLPEPISKADLSKPFIYDREYGVFYCNFGTHYLGMWCLLSFQDGIENLPSDHHVAADKWLSDKSGRAFKSSVSRGVFAGKIGCLNAIERRFFGNSITYINGLIDDDVEIYK